MRKILGLMALGAGAYAFTRYRSAGKSDGNAAFSADQPQAGQDAVRDAGPDAMRDPPVRPWSQVDEESDQSFPASDPPANY
jgi:hypothetical protein